MEAISKTEVKARVGGLRRSAGRARGKIAELQKRLSEAVERQAVTAEILKVINRSSSDLQPESRKAYC